MDPTRLVEDWQKPMYNLAYRMLGNEADAADATQEIFSTVLKKIHLYKPSQAFKPWIYRLGTNVILNFIRDSKLHREKERQAAMKEEPLFEAKKPEQKELESALSRELARLPEESRTALVLRYYQGLSQTEVAESLEIPRTTLQTRLDKGLESIKQGLAGAGFMVAVPHLESLMQNAAPLAVPPALGTSLTAIGTKAALTASSPASLAVGGILVSKPIIAAAILIGLASLGAGIMVGRNLSTAVDSPNQAAQGSEYESAKAAVENLKIENAKLGSRVKELESERENLREASLRKAVAAPETPAAEKLAAPSHPVASPAGASNKIDWDKFSTMFADNLDEIEGVLRGHKEDSELTPEQQKAMMDLFAEAMKVSGQMKVISSKPIFDKTLFPDFMLALCGKSLKLSPEQAQQMRANCDSVLAQQLSGFNPETALPIEVLAKRESLMDRFTAATEAMLSAEQRVNWGKVKPATSHLTNSDQSILDFPLDIDEAGNAKTDKNPVADVMKQWNKGYGLDVNQQSLAKDLASQYVAEAKKMILQNPPKDPESTKRFQEELMAFQIQKERELFALLTGKQKEAALKRMPVVMRFNTKGNYNSNTSRGAPF